MTLMIKNSWLSSWLSISGDIILRMLHCLLILLRTTRTSSTSAPPKSLLADKPVGQSSFHNSTLSFDSILDVLEQSQMLSLYDGTSTQKGGIMAMLLSIHITFTQSSQKNSYPPLSMSHISLFHPSMQPPSLIKNHCTLTFSLLCHETQEQEPIWPTQKAAGPTVEAEERWDQCSGLYKNNNKNQNPKQPLLSQVHGEINQTQRDNERNNKTHQEPRQG
jgi:hypothetical protein